MKQWTIIHNFSHWNNPQSNILLSGPAQNRPGDQGSNSWHIYTEWPEKNTRQYFSIQTRPNEWNIDNYYNIYQKIHTEKDFWVIHLSTPQGCIHQAAAFPATDIHSPCVHCDFLPPGEFLDPVPGLAQCGFCCWLRIDSVTQYLRWDESCNHGDCMHLKQ